MIPITAILTELNTNKIIVNNLWTNSEIITIITKIITIIIDIMETEV